MEKGTKEYFEIDRRDTCAEQCIVHTGGNIKPVNTDSKSHKVKHRTEFLVLAVILVGMVIGLYSYIFYQLNVELPRFFENLNFQSGGIEQQISELRSDVVENRRLIEANATQLKSLRLDLAETKTLKMLADTLQWLKTFLAKIPQFLQIFDLTSS